MACKNRHALGSCPDPRPWMTRKLREQRQYGGKPLRSVRPTSSCTPSTSELDCLSNDVHGLCCHSSAGQQRSQIFNTRLTKDPRKKITGPRLKSETNACSLAQLVKATEEAHRVCYSKQTPGIARFQQILLAINKHALVADVLIQHQPQVTALVWGSIRFLIQVLCPLSLPLACHRR